MLTPGRQQAATPPLDISAIFVLDDSTVSGYDGASEDEGEAAMDNTATTGREETVSSPETDTVVAIWIRVVSVCCRAATKSNSFSTS